MGVGRRNLEIVVRSEITDRKPLTAQRSFDWNFKQSFEIVRTRERCDGLVVLIVNPNCISLNVQCARIARYGPGARTPQSLSVAQTGVKVIENRRIVSLIILREFIVAANMGRRLLDQRFLVGDPLVRN